MIKEELRARLREANNPQERRSLLEEYRVHLMRTTTARYRYKQMDRMIRSLRRVGKEYH